MTNRYDELIRSTLGSMVAEAPEPMEFDQLTMPVTQEALSRRRWPQVATSAVAFAAVLVLVGGAAFLFQVSEPDAPVADTVVPTTLTESTPTTVAAPDLDYLRVCDAASAWSRVCDAAAGFDGALMWGATAGGPGLVAVGGEDEYSYWEDIDPTGYSAADGDAVVWTSPDGATWSRVTHTEAVFGGDGAQQMFGVTAGGPGLVAVGFDGTLGNEAGNAAVWTSPDGVTWSRVPHDDAVFGGVGEQRMLSVTVAGPGLVAVGHDWPADTDLVDAAVWTSPDGVTWSRVPHDEAVFGGAGEQQMLSVTSGGPGLVAVGYDSFDFNSMDAAVWTSPDGVTWSRVPHDAAVFGGAGEQQMLGVTAGGPGLVAVGFDGFPQGPWYAAVWTSQDGITWSQVLDSQAPFVGAYTRMFSVTVAGSGLVAVGREAGGNLAAAVWQN